MITEALKDRMRAACARYPDRRSGMLPCLHLVQEAEGYVTPEGIQAVAEIIGCKVDEVESIVTFYAMFFTRPVGKHIIKVCTSISCYLRGCDDLIAHFEERLGIKRGETTPDGQFTLLPIECLAACGMAPVLQVNNEFVENVTREQADALIERLQRGASIASHPGEWEAAEHTAAVRAAASAAGTDRKKAE